MQNRGTYKQKISEFAFADGVMITARKEEELANKVVVKDDIKINAQKKVTVTAANS